MACFLPFGAHRRAGVASSIVCCAAVAAMLCVPAAADAASAGSSSRQAREDAQRAIPWANLSRSDQRSVQYVVRKASLFRRTPTHAFDCDPQVFSFLAQHPEVVVNVWNLMGVSKLSLARTGDQQYQAADSAGTHGALRVVYSSYEPDGANTIVALADGAYHTAPMREPLKAHCVLVLRSASRRETDDRTYVTARLDSFVRFERVGADLVAKTLRPLLVKSADHNFTETMKFVSTFSRTAEQRPEGLVNLASKLERVDPATRAELAHLCRQTAQRTAAAEQARPVRLAELQQPME